MGQWMDLAFAPYQLDGTMSRRLHRLTALGIRQKKKPGLYADGGGLYLRVSPTGARSWVFRYRQRGGRHDKGLGSVAAVSLAQARRKAGDDRTTLSEGRDPIQDRRQSEAALMAGSVTFKDCAEAYIRAHKDGWRNAKHAVQWGASLEAYVYPVFGALPVGEIDIPHVMRALEPIWKVKTETASRVRGRIEAVLDWARVSGYRSSDNPARWRGQLANLLPARARVRPVQHHPALPYAEIGNFMQDLRGQEGEAARALEFLILTAARTGEVIGANWDEINFETATWTIPASRIKAGKDHRVPLSPPAIKLLKAQAEVRQSSWLFAGGKQGRPLSSNAMLALLRRMERSDLTAHGFRSTFRDWAAELTNYPREIAEAALAHRIPDPTERAYRRGDLFAKRARLMAEWARYCDTMPKVATVTPIRDSG